MVSSRHGYRKLSRVRILLPSRAVGPRIARGRGDPGCGRSPEGRTGDAGYPLNISTMHRCGPRRWCSASRGHVSAHDEPVAHATVTSAVFNARESLAPVRDAVTAVVRRFRTDGGPLGLTVAELTE